MQNEATSKIRNFNPVNLFNIKSRSRYIGRYDKINYLCTYKYFRLRFLCEINYFAFGQPKPVEAPNLSDLFSFFSLIKGVTIFTYGLNTSDATSRMKQNSHYFQWSTKVISDYLYCVNLTYFSKKIYCGHF